jgi:O-antigen/teichoic acid export membrane protein
MKVSLALAAIVVLQYFFTDPALDFYLYAIIINSFSIAHAKLEAEARGSLLFRFLFFGTLVFSVIKCLAIGYDDAVRMLGYVFFVEAIYTCLLPFIYLVCKRVLSYSLTNVSLVELIKESLPLWVSGAVAMLYLRTDQFVIQHFMGSVPLGVYSLATRLVEAAFMLPSAALASIMGYLVVSGSKDEVFLYSVFFLTSMIIGISLSIFGFFYIHYVLGVAYAEAVWPLTILSLSLPFTALRVINGKFLILHNLQMHSLYRSLISLVVNFVLSVLLIQWLGIVGVALATLLTVVLSSLFVDFISPKTKPFYDKKIQAITDCFNKDLYKRLYALAKDRA